MSHYAKINTVYKYKKELVDALEKIYGKGNVIVSSNGLPLTNYNGLQDRNANIIVRSDTIRQTACHQGKAADLGFVLEDGHYRMIADNYGGVLTDTYLNLPRYYAESVIRNRLSPYKYRMLSSEKDRIVLEVK